MIQNYLLYISTCIFGFTAVFTTRFRFGRRLSIGRRRGHPASNNFSPAISRMDVNVDAKQILTSSPSLYWNRPSGQPRMTWMKTVQNDLDSHGLSWTDAEPS